MTEIFFSLISDKLFVAVFQNGTLVTSICEDNRRQHSENFVQKVANMFRDANLQIQETERVFFLRSSGSQIGGERISQAFVVGLMISKPSLQVFSINGLYFQSLNLKEAISISTVGEKSRKYNVHVYKEGQLLLTKYGLEESQLQIVKNEYPGFSIVTNFTETNFLINFQISKNEFIPFKGY